MLSIPRYTRSLLDSLENEVNDLWSVYPLDYIFPSRSQAASRSQLAVPTITGNKYNVNVDLHQFEPSEVSVKFEGNSLQINGKREIKGEDGQHYEYRQYVQHFTVPDSVDHEKLKCHLDDRGILRVEAPVKVPQIEENSKQRHIPIEFVKK